MTAVTLTIGTDGKADFRGNGFTAGNLVAPFAEHPAE